MYTYNTYVTTKRTCINFVTDKIYALENTTEFVNRFEIASEIALQFSFTISHLKIQWGFTIMVNQSLTTRLAKERF